MLRSQQTCRSASVLYRPEPFHLGKWPTVRSCAIKRVSDDEPLKCTRLWNSYYLSSEERRALQQAVTSRRSVNAHVDLVSEGELADSLLFIVEGWACRYATTIGGGRHFSALLVPGDLCNLEALLIDRPDCGVRTMTAATIVALPRELALALATQHSGIARAFTWLALVENAILAKWALSLGRRSAKEKLAHLFCELSLRVGAQEREYEVSFNFPPTQEQIADAVGLTAVHVNRTMQVLRAEGLVAIASRIMTLSDVPRLRQIGGFDPGYLHLDRVRANTQPPLVNPNYPRSRSRRGS
ncbi:Crp/Fnr family transcriptional regulator [Glacieibacterium frigidum]|uniref:Crp/Fnr family transcriptional regulator n=1 Tax=Glacieibacterium frigidum TaxID=2593303 RepID=A0A552U975_9SPHN|nr:Crp/Fnr family transcriptional regulator [Glacieibacterium frigidum]TRW14777.1 Crp/Fnr family transcriptional regulator [Glacieibacterium frigidum]